MPKIKTLLYSIVKCWIRQHEDANVIKSHVNKRELMLYPEKQRVFTTSSLLMFIHR